MKATKINSHKLAIITAILLLIGTLVYQGFEGQQETLKQLNDMLPGAVSFEKINGKCEAYKVFDVNKETMGYVAIASASGYGGPITVMAGINAEGQILKASITKDHETPVFLQRVINEGFVRRIEGKHVSDPFLLKEDLDAVSGATISSEGIANAVRKAAHQVATSELGVTIVEQPQSLISLDAIFLIVLYGLILLGLWKKYIKLRPLVLVLSVFFLGFRLNAPISLANMASLLSGNFPSIVERPFWFLLVLGVLVITLLLGRNFYCYWLCPFGAVQEGLHKILFMFRYNPTPRVVAIGRKMRLVLVWLALMMAFVFGNPSIAGYEPFSAFFSAKANQGQWLLMGFALIIGVPISRFWCRFFCPVGAVIDLTVSFKKLVLKKQQKSEIEITDTTQKTDRVNDKNYLFLAVLVTVFIIVLYTLILNVVS
ncbi:FMN-binding protein [Desulfitobacterium hafniense]|uniref:FMN-binding protein n=1 Tax=Desulfitobacterium hafniense TaxID=49338 RepID=UPI000369D640|nr:FMN-binding protein [Desulfitobacterium hafniense]